MNRILLHIAFWVFFVLWSSATFDCPSTYLQVVGYTLVRLPVLMIATYILIYVLVPKFLIKEQSYWKFAFYCILNFLCATLLDRWVSGSDIVDYILSTEDIEFTFFSEKPIFRNSFLLFSVMGLASMIKYFKLYTQKAEIAHQLKEDSLTARHNFLKAQLNPHFLFNALNNIYSLSLQKNQTEIGESISQLSGIMQYLTYESSSDFVPLQKEVALINNYIKVQQLRLSDQDDVTISFQVNGDIKNRIIAPVILLPLVENTFKHGIKHGHPSIIKIEIRVIGKQLLFTTRNSKFSANKKSENHGVGIDNVKRRLELTYDDRHTLDTTVTEKYYTCSLRIDL